MDSDAARWGGLDLLTRSSGRLEQGVAALKLNGLGLFTARKFRCCCPTDVENSVRLAGSTRVPACYTWERKKTLE